MQSRLLPEFCSTQQGGSKRERRDGSYECGPASTPPAAPFPPFPPYPPFAPFAPFPPFPAYPPYPPTPCAAPGDDGSGAAGQAGDGGDAAGAPGGAGGAPGESTPPGGDTPLIFPPSIPVRRPDDLLVCTLRFTGFAFLQDPARLDRAADDAYITVEFPPQSFGEEAFLQVKAQTFEIGAQQVEVTRNPDYPPQHPRCR